MSAIPPEQQQNLETLAKWAAKKDHEEGGVANGVAIIEMLVLVARARQEASPEQLAAVRAAIAEVKAETGPFHVDDLTAQLKAIMGWS